MDTSTASFDPRRLVANRRARIRYLTSNGGRGRGVLKMHDFAARAGLSVSFLSKFVRGEWPNLTLSTLAQIDAALTALENDKAVMRAVEAVHAKYQARAKDRPTADPVNADTLSQ